MKLLFDQNLSFKLCGLLADLFPASSQVRLLGLAEADDGVIWEAATKGGFVIVSQDSDFADRACLYGAPPRVIWLRCGNQSTDFIERLIRCHSERILEFDNDLELACLELG